MACNNRSKVYLGYEDEYITDKYRSFINFMTNKIGGKPDFHNKENSLPLPVCRLCGLNQLLVLQLYTPLENSKYHRTLYIFACINPNCWNQNDSWTCLRIQSLEEKTINDTDLVTSAFENLSTTSWLSDADDWGDDGNDNLSEQNGNNNMPNESNKLNLFSNIDGMDEKLDDDLSNLMVNDPNANSPGSRESPVGGGGGGGAVGQLENPQASAILEGEESEVVCIDTPTQPQCNLIDLLHQVTTHPFQHYDEKSQINLVFAELFINVDEEDLSLNVPQHVRDLFLEYQICNPDALVDSLGSSSDEPKSIDILSEKYEKSIPKHGDEMFHDFLCRIQMNPGQLLRYCRDNSAPLILYPLGANFGSCKYCGADRIFEVQVLPTIIPKLKLVPNNDCNFEIEFGTVLILTCSKSCWTTTDTYKEELVIVQGERL